MAHHKRCAFLIDLMENVTNIFNALGERLSRFGCDDISRCVLNSAIESNAWFTESDIMHSIDAICKQMLQPDKIEHWLSLYNIDNDYRPEKRIALIMAGNIPLVGFADLMCTIASGNIPCVKYSSKDKALMEYVVTLLQDIEPELKIELYDKSVAIDAVIATGGESANLYFGAEYADTPHIFRGNRHSVAVLSGNETEKELAGLADDIFLYSGLGCRNVSLLFVPRNYELHLPAQRKMCRAYHNNYLQCRALLTMCNTPFYDSTEAVFVYGKADFPASPSRINIVGYDSLNDVKKWLVENNGRLQCVVSSLPLDRDVVRFGEAQRPSLTDYPDGVDVMEFLLSV